MNQRLSRPLAMLIFSAGLSFVLWSAATTSTVAPSQVRFASLTGLINEQGPAAGAMTVLRLAMFATSLYLAGLMLMTVLARATRRTGFERLLAGFTPRAIRPVFGVLAATSAFVAQPVSAQSSHRAPVMIHIDNPTPATSPAITIATASVSPTVTQPDSSPTTTGPTMQWIGPAGIDAHGAPPISTPPPTPTTSESSDERRAAPTTTTWTVERGDHLWHIAEATLLGRLDRLPTAQETHRYWTKVIAANRDRLANPDNPNLIYPGQQFVLPGL